ncbi:MAG: ACP S-malonyltransferase [Deltaproteobacteria bacterium]|nr:ACP S-malonyltransferase [Deltaproteobacteria bacterium]
MTATAWLFPGQGTQTVGMGKALYDASPAARAVFERADRALGFPISRLCFEGPEADLTLTANTQPAILTTSLAALAALREALPSLPDPAFAAGHSLGEYSALVAAGALELEDAVRLVRLRGEAMQAAVPEGTGAMAAILGGDSAAVSALCAEARGDDVLAPANFNAPGQVVIAGHAAAVARARELAGSRKLKAIPLAVSAPFHCSLMAPAARAVAAALDRIPVQNPRFPVVANVDARPATTDREVRAQLVRQVDGAVRWEESVAFIVAQGVTRAFEIGPGRVLAGLARKIDKRLEVLGVADPAGVAEAATPATIPG